MAKRLKGYSVLVTRPQDQAGGLCAAIESEGGLAVRAPMIVIQKLDHPPATVRAIDEYDALIFISRNAVEYGLEYVADRQTAPLAQPLYAVGVGTSAALRERGYPNVVTPAGEYSSEGLLKVPGLQSATVKDQRILIFRGRGGREHLAESLTSRGAQVDYCEIYERRSPTNSVTEILKASGIQAPDIAVITSLEGLGTYADKIDDEGLDLLFDVPLLVVGSRIAGDVEKLGFTNAPVIVDNPKDDTILMALVSWVMDEI